MKKLKVKVFSVIFLLLTIFTFMIFAASTIKEYIGTQNSIEDTLHRIINLSDNSKNRNRPSNIPPSKNDQENNSRRIFLDFTVYTIILDENGNYKELINHTNNDELEEETIKKISEEIINNHEDNMFIGNLYTNKYSYAFSQNSLIIVDNTNTNSELTKELINNIILFLLCEGVIFAFTYIITKWIITPVNKTFEKQKAFVADASHELKTPLSVMVASADAYFNDKDDKWVKNIKSESERMIKLVTELLDLAKMEQDQDIQMEENNLSDIIESSILTFESLFYDNKINLKYNITPQIKMKCNENLITELMSILIDNAISYCKEKGKVDVNLTKKNSQVILEVRNTGNPIKKEDEEKIFERFYKVDSSRNRNTNNYGLGLAIAKSIVEKHKGNISAHSENGYTTFKVIWNQK